MSSPPHESAEEQPGQTIMPARAKTAELELNDHTDANCPTRRRSCLPRSRARRIGAMRRRRSPDEIAAAMHFEPFPEYDISLSLELDPKIATEEPADLADLDPTEFTPNAPPSLEGLNAEVKETRLYFGNDLFGTTLGGMQPWGTGEEPVLMAPRVPADPDMKQIARRCRRRPSRGVTRRRQGRGDRRRPAPEEPGRAAWPCRARSAPRRRSASPTRSISNRAASRCAGRSRSRRW